MTKPGENPTGFEEMPADLRPGSGAGLLQQAGVPELDRFRMQQQDTVCGTATCRRTCLRFLQAKDKEQSCCLLLT